MRRRSEKQKVLEQSDTERNSIDNDKPDIDHQEDDQGILPEVQQLPERPGRKRKGLMKVTKQRITAVRRRRQPRKEPSPLTTPAEPAEQAVEPVSQSSPTSETTQCPQEPSGTSTAVQVLTESSSSPDSADQQYSQHPETPSPPVSPGPSMPPAEPPAYASPASASPVPSARQLEKRRAHMDASREASASLDEGATASSTTTPDELFQSSISQINRPEYDHTMYSGHVATDDKALLAQRSTLASAPSHDNHIESTPTTSAHFSAPEVEVDYDGYEIHDHPEPPPEPPVHGDLPAPPTAMNQSSIPVATLPPQLREASAPDFGDHVSEEPSAPEGWLPLPLYEAREEERSDDLHNPILRGSQNGSSEHGLRMSGIDV